MGWDVGTNRAKRVVSDRCSVSYPVSTHTVHWSSGNCIGFGSGELSSCPRTVSPVARRMSGVHETPPPRYVVRGVPVRHPFVSGCPDFRIGPLKEEEGKEKIER